MTFLCVCMRETETENCAYLCAYMHSLVLVLSLDGSLVMRANDVGSPAFERIAVQVAFLTSLNSCVQL